MCFFLFKIVAFEYFQTNQDNFLFVEWEKNLARHASLLMDTHSMN